VSMSRVLLSWIPLLLLCIACQGGRKAGPVPAGPTGRAVLTGDLIVPLEGAGKDDGTADPERRIARRTLRRAGEPVSWPYEDVDISSPYGFRIHPTLQVAKMHRGLDFPRALGMPVLAMAGGAVEKVMYDGVYGNVVFLTHDGGWQTVYAHLAEITVLPGEFVDAGALVGLTGSTGRSTGSHLHLGVLVDGRSVDPLYFIGRTWSSDRLSGGPLPSLGGGQKNTPGVPADDPDPGD
jgi:murein DD-endopeptidase MepM/ murein hydrolase activator NlpD